MALEKLNWDNGFNVADGYSDIRGWKLYDSGSEDVGTVDDLLFDPSDREVRYAVATIDGRRKLIPIGQIEIESTNRRVVAKGFTRDRLVGLRDYEESSWNDTHERNTYGQFASGWKETDKLDYRREEFRGKELPQTIRLMEERLKVGKTREQIGEVEVGKRVVTEQVTEDVTLRRDNIEIERHQVDRPAAAGETIIGNNETIRVPVYGEEVVTQKTPFVKEEVEIRNNPTSETKTVREEVRREELAFSGTEPTDKDFAERQRLEKERVRPTEDIEIIPEENRKDGLF